MNSKKSGLAGAVKLSLSTLVVAAAVGLPVAGQAGTDTDDIVVSAVVRAQCSFVNASDMSFGNVDPLTGGTATAPVSIQCNRGAQPSLSSNATGAMKNAGDTSTLTYSLGVAVASANTDCAGGATTILNGAAATLNLWGATGGPKPLTLCGVVGGNQTETLAENHSETVTLTLSY